jgi:uncharacterized protein YbjT (DUF2867 family)
MNDKIIAVTGATGQQGGAVVRKLLADGWKIRGLTRDPDKVSSRELAAAGVDVVAGDMEQRAQLESAFKGAHGVFSVQNYWLPTVGFEGEVRQGRNVADAAKAAGVEHLVYSSVGAAERGMGQKHFESKWIIEQYVQSLGIPYTILRPVAFMENYNWSRAQILNGFLPGRGIRPEKATQIIAVEDIAFFAALAFKDPKSFLSRTIELAGDELTEAQAAGVFARVIGRPVTVAPPNPRAGMNEDEAKAMFNFFNGKAYTADIAALRKMHPGLLTLEQYLRKHGWENADPMKLPGAAPSR